MAIGAPTLRLLRSRTFLRILSRLAPLTDLTTIAVVRILFEEGFFPEWLKLWAGLTRAADRDYFIQTATGAVLDRRIADYGLVRPAARAASGWLTVSVDSGTTTVPAGVAVETLSTDGADPKRYAVAANPDTADGSWSIAAPGGQVRIVAAVAGAAGNTPAATITALRTSVAHVTGISNAAPLVNGRDIADDDETRQYFRDALASLTRGTRPSILFAIRDFVDEATGQAVHSVALQEWNGVPLFTLDGTRQITQAIYIEDGSGTASSALVQAVQALLDGDDSEASGYRAAGATAEVRSAAVLPLDVQVEVDADRAANALTVQAAVDNAVREHLVRLPVGGELITGGLQGQLNFAQLFRRVMNVDGVLRANFLTPIADANVPIGRKLMPATVQVTVN